MIPLAVAAFLQVHHQLEVDVHCQLTELVVADPAVVAARVTKSHSVGLLRPRTSEELGPLDVLLDQHRSAVGYRTHVNVANCLIIGLLLIIINTNKKLSYRRGTARRAVTVKTVLNVAQMFVKLHLISRALNE